MAFKFSRGRGNTDAILFGVVALIVVLVVVLLFRGSTHEGYTTTTPNTPPPGLIYINNDTTGSSGLILTYAAGNNITVNSISGIGNTNQSTAIASSIPGVNNGNEILLFDSDYQYPNANGASGPQLTNFSGATITGATWTQSGTTPPSGGIQGITGTLTLNVSGGTGFTGGSATYSLVNLNNVRGTKTDPCLTLYSNVSGNGYFCKNIYQYYFLRTA